MDIEGARELRFLLEAAALRRGGAVGSVLLPPGGEFPRVKVAGRYLHGEAGGDGSEFGRVGRVVGSAEDL